TMLGSWSTRPGHQKHQDCIVLVSLICSDSRLTFDKVTIHMLARPCDRHPGALAKPARQRLKILLARPLRSYALAAVLKHAHRGPPITDGVGGSGNGHGRINASPAALIRAPCATQAFTVIRADATLCRRPHIDTRRWTSPMTASAGWDNPPRRRHIRPGSPLTSSPSVSARASSPCALGHGATVWIATHAAFREPMP